MAESYYQWKRRIASDEAAREAWEAIAFLEALFDSHALVLSYLGWALGQLQIFEVLRANYTDEQLEAILMLGEMLDG